MTPALDTARAIGDAVLYEGYLLYPYRASAAKNAVRWQFGVLMPPGYADPACGEYAASRTECLLEPGPAASLHVRVRFLHLQRRTVYDGDREVDTLTVDGTTYLSWDEAVERELDLVVPLDEPAVLPLHVEGSRTEEDLGSGARLVRRTWPLTGELTVRAEPLDGPYGGAWLRVDLRNTTPWCSDDPQRHEALRHALLAAHLVLGLDSGHFLSLADPPEWAGAAAKECTNERTWPVVIDDAVILSSPIILSDRPEIAPESVGPMFDGTEIDEILTLRTMTLTDDEKREARATDPRAADLLDRADTLPPELLDRLHGTVRYLRGVQGVTGETDPGSDSSPETDDRAALAAITAPPEVPWWDPGADRSVDPATDSLVVDGVALAAGDRVLLQPGHKRADAQDMFLTGRSATVRAVLSDVDGERYVAVTLDEDPAADLQHAHGRYRYFTPHEIVPYDGAPR